LLPEEEEVPLMQSQFENRTTRTLEQSLSQDSSVRRFCIGSTPLYFRALGQFLVGIGIFSFVLGMIKFGSKKAESGE
jgi:hypothetical protein